MTKEAIKLNKFTNLESKFLIFIFIVLFSVSGFNIALSLRRGRDATRKNDLASMQKAIDLFKQKYKEFPISTTDGKVIGCFNEEPKFDELTGKVSNALVCEWGESSFENIKVMVRDPSFQKGASYLYISDGKKYEIYIALEGKDEAEYTESIANKNLQCGKFICNYGRWSD